MVIIFAAPNHKKATEGIEMRTGFMMELWNKALLPSFSVHWMFLLSALLMAYLVYRRRGAECRHRSLHAFLFPKDIWLHPSAILDYRLLLLTMPVWSMFVVPLLSSNEDGLRHIQTQLLPAIGQRHPAAVHNQFVAIAYTVVLLFASDLRHYWLHRCMHRVRPLWEFHKVHHSAAVLTPFTAYRAHPVEMALQTISESLSTGVVTALFQCFAASDVSAITIFGVNAGRFLFYLLGANLQHSHVYLSYGTRLEHLFISPAQHPIHHSIEHHHVDRNFGLKFAIWDWAWGTLYCSGSNERLKLGLPSSDAGAFNNEWDLFWGPLKNNFTALRAMHQEFARECRRLL